MPQPLKHQRTFRIRHYECDAYGHVNNANYLRFMQETAFDASAVAGYNMRRYAELGAWWWIRETGITYLRPLTYGDSVQVDTWVANFRRVRSRRVYSFRDAATGDLVAEAYSDWIYLDRATLRPQAIPADMVEAFFPDGTPDAVPPPRPLPKAPPAPPDVYAQRRRVQWHDLDMMQHVNNAVYLSYLEAASIGVCEAYGWPYARMQEAGFGIVARQYQIEYLQAAKLGDELKIATWASHGRRSSAIRHYTVERLPARTLLASGSALWVWIDLRTGKPIRIPHDFLAAFADNIVT